MPQLNQQLNQQFNQQFNQQQTQQQTQQPKSLLSGLESFIAPFRKFFKTDTLPQIPLPPNLTEPKESVGTLPKPETGGISETGGIFDTKTREQFGDALLKIVSPGLKALRDSVKAGSIEPYKQFLKEKIESLKTPEGLFETAIGFVPIGGAISPEVNRLSASALKEGEKVIAKFLDTDIGKKLSQKFGQEVEAEIVGKPFRVPSGAVLVQAKIGEQKVNLPISKHVEFFERIPKEIPKEIPEAIAKTSAEGIPEVKPEVKAVTGGIKPPTEGKIEGLEEPLQPPQPPQEIIDAFDNIVRLLKEAIKISPNDVKEVVARHKQVNKAVADLFRRGILDVNKHPEFAKWGYSGEEAANAIEKFATFSGQGLNRTSQWEDKLRRVLPEDIIRDIGKVPAGWVDTVYNKVADVINAWRASLTAQLSTAVRNAEVGLKLFSFRTVEDALVGATKAVTGKAPPKRAFAPVIEDMNAILYKLSPARRQKLAEILDANPLAKEKLYGTPVNDITLSGKYANAVSIFNRTQEFAIRNLVFDATLRGELAKMGKNLDNLLPSEIPQKAIRKAVEESLRITMALRPKGFWAELVRLFNKTPTNILAVLTYPFPRYLSNSIRAIYEFSPVGVTKFIHPKYREALLKLDEEAMRLMARAFIGTGLFATSVYLRNSKYAGEKWYEIKMGKRTMDMRPFGPLIPTYMFIAEAMKDTSKFSTRDVIEGLTGISRLAGTTLFMVSMLDNQRPDTLLKAIKELGGTFLAGFTVPLRTFKDFVSHFSDEEAILRYTKENPLVGRAMANIPLASRLLPEAPSLTRAEPLKNESPLLRQLTGLSLRREKNFLEKELDRLGIQVSQLWPKTGNTEVDRLIAKEVGPIMERVSEALSKSDKYASLDDFDKKEELRAFFSDAKRDAKAKVLRERQKEIAEEILDNLEHLETKEQRKEYLKRMHQRGLLTNEILDTMELLTNR